MLSQGTAALPKIDLPEQLPPRWAQDTQGAIASGILYTVKAGLKSFIDDWLTQYPESQLIITGGDGLQLKQFVQPSNLVKFNPDLVLEGFIALAKSSNKL